LLKRALTAEQKREKMARNALGFCRLYTYYLSDSGLKGVADETVSIDRGVVALIDGDGRSLGQRGFSQS
jgi:hypothetical protein